MQHKERVRGFLSIVRSGKAPERAGEFMAPQIRAHQVVSEVELTVERTPKNYEDHIRWMSATYGSFDFVIEDLLADGDRVYARWKQTGMHLGEIDGFAPTGKEVVEVASCTYRLVDGRIVEYWIQIDREGLRIQLERNAKG